MNFAVPIFTILVSLFADAVALSDEPSTQTGAPTIWPQWRGPSRDGHISQSPVWPDRLSEDVLQLAWKKNLGPSYSGPIVSEELVFVTETKDKKEEVVKAFDRTTGQLRWDRSWAGSLSVPFFAKENGDWIRATPAYDGKSLFVAGMRDELVCLDAKSGQEQWRVDFVKDFGNPLPAFGFVSSPLIDGDHVFVQAGAACVKLEKGTGKIVWRALQDSGGMFGSAFASPYLAELAGKRQLLVQTREKLAGLDPGNGDVLWSQNIPAFRGMNILTPTTSGNTVFTSAYGGKSLSFSISAEESKPALKADEMWTNKATGYMSSPVLCNDHIYLHLRNQRFTCINASSGETRWTTRPFGKYWSMVTNGQKILALDERGELLLIRVNPQQFELIEARKISEEPTWAHLAVCGEEVFIRELNAIAAYRWRPAP